MPLLGTITLDVRGGRRDLWEQNARPPDRAAHRGFRCVCHRSRAPVFVITPLRPFLTCNPRGGCERANARVIVTEGPASHRSPTPASVVEGAHGRS